MSDDQQWDWEVIDGEVVRVLVEQKPANQPRVRAKRTPTPPEKRQKEYPHGHPYRYYTYGCRCDECKKAGSEYARQLRHRRQQDPPDNLVHGKANTYKHFGCRCTPCRKAIREYQRGFKESVAAQARRNERKREKRRLAQIE